jgi:hypothetical protein
MRGAVLAGIVLLALVAGFAPTASAELPDGRGALLPLQDRVGEASLARLTEDLLRSELLGRADLAESDAVRAVLRSMRVRDASNEPPDRLAAVASELDVDWFFLATLHEARAGRSAVRADGGVFGDAGDTPQVVLSGKILRSDSPALWWAGFDGLSGKDSERAFGLGRVEMLDELIRNVVSRLVAEAGEPRALRGQGRPRPVKGSFLRSGSRPAPPETVAVIPMDSVAALEPTASAEMATAALFAVLDELGFRPLLPGFVRGIREATGQVQYGGTSRSEWEVLATEGGAKWVATGTVETFVRGQGEVPNPRIGFSVRFLDTGDGKIAWSHGHELTGQDTAGMFDRGRIFSTGDLTHEMMRSLLGELRLGSGTEETIRRK